METEPLMMRKEILFSLKVVFSLRMMVSTLKQTRMARPTSIPTTQPTPMQERSSTLLHR